MTKNDIFYLDEDYEKKAKFCNENGFIIVELEPDSKGRRFQIQELPPKTQEEILQELRNRREEECFSIINRGALWYNTLSEDQLQSLNEWYNAWLKVTETLKVPEKPMWLK